MREVQFIVDEYYHIYSKVILNRSEFKESRNAKRLTQAFLLCNSTESTKAFQYLKNNENASLEDAIEIIRKGEKLVDILCYTIMPDHYHLLLRERKENGITEFMRKSNISIAKYINTKDERKGPLFESRFKAKHINSNKYLLHLSVYIHLNPLDFISGKYWREHKLGNWNCAKEKLLKYPWSSLRMYLNKNYQDPIVSGIEIILNQFNNQKEYELFLRDWSQTSLENIKECLID